MLVMAWELIDTEPLIRGEAEVPTPGARSFGSANLRDLLEPAADKLSPATTDIV